MMNCKLLLPLPALLWSVVCAGAPPTDAMDVNILNEPLQVQNVNEPTEEYYQQSVSITWNSPSGTHIAQEFPVFGPSGDEGLPADRILVLDHVGLKIDDRNSPPIGGIHCSLVVRSGNTGRNLNHSEFPIVTTAVPNYDSAATGIKAVYVASQPIVQYHYSYGRRPTLRCIARKAPTYTISVKADIIGRLLSRTQ